MTFPFPEMKVPKIAAFVMLPVTAGKSHARIHTSLIGADFG
jgi:hypothetical protein